MPHANAAVDLSHLDRYTGGERALNIEVLALFEAQCAEMARNLKTAAASGDAKVWHMATHTLKGAARGIGALALADTAAEAERADAADVAATGAAGWPGWKPALPKCGCSSPASAVEKPSPNLYEALRRLAIDAARYFTSISEQ